ncbi:hypothetical protein M431DRAFT_215376 [Trichoderma harzianum CBS 226.95]|uniref:Uncharacterized protein n=1 Tax=Trichoderma harzianum CBS 226.95 TaxID=983964 RepID=A0A2T4A5F2_TRIHA|nr:hypothetical protein M431DRAFT_215376 [Trichoderma harzianum CBS 226.95]PTB52300.1 hypothetical protein M431DRAFT_215376 [Trichoderma harzianum CBS 226.95]
MGIGYSRDFLSNLSTISSIIPCMLAFCLLPISGAEGYFVRGRLSIDAWAIVRCVLWYYYAIMKLLKYLLKQPQILNRPCVSRERRPGVR